MVCSEIDGVDTGKLAMKFELTRGIFAPAVDPLITSMNISESIKYFCK